MNENLKKETISWVLTLLVAFIIFFVCRQFLFAPVKVEGKSMVPTFENNNRIMISKITKISHFDMIVFHSPVAGSDYIKRVIGVPGDTIEIRNDVLYVNGKKYKEPYLEANKKKVMPGQNLTGNLKVTVPAGSLYVMGDNRQYSSDSRDFGFVPKKDVVGEVVFRFYPLNEISIPK